MRSRSVGQRPGVDQPLWKGCGGSDPSRLRYLFAGIFNRCPPLKPDEVLTRFARHLFEDYLRRLCDVWETLPVHDPLVEDGDAPVDDGGALARSIPLMS